MLTPCMLPLTNCAETPRSRAPLSFAAALLCVAFTADAVAQGSIASDRAALEALYDATGGASWADSANWKTAAPLDEWYGVTTDAEGRVTSLELRDNGLSGSIPAAVGSLAKLEWLALSSNALTGRIPPELGSLENLASLALGSNELTGPIPRELGSLARVLQLHLAGNALTGPIPRELGDLESIEYLTLSNNQLSGRIPGELGSLGALQELWLNDNALTGPIPVALTDLDKLLAFDVSRTDVCFPSDPAFRRWKATIEARGGWFAAASCDDHAGDRAVLTAFYDATGGPGWRVGTNWKTEAPLRDWHGVRTDADGRVSELALSGNALTGPIPDALGRLGALQQLSLADNALTGLIPVALTDLDKLLVFDVSRTDVCIPSDLAFRRWKAAIEARGGWFAAASCDDHAGDRAVLTAFYDATGGAGWRIGTNWKTAAPLRDWHGVTTDADGRVSELALSANALTGPIPDALGRLTSLQRLSLGGNELTGPIPAALGDLTSLRWLFLDRNALTGPIPAELGSLLNLTTLDLSRNDLTGPIPAALGRLENLGGLSLAGNDLTGPVPAALGNLASLASLVLGENDLTGPLPAELGRLENLQRLDLSYNWGLSGPLPADLEQSALEELDFFVTQTCAPAAWDEWLATIEFWGPSCEAEADGTIDVAVIYTPTALEAAGGAAAIEAEIDLMIAETNEAYAASGVRHRLALVVRSETPYTETDGFQDIDRLADPSDGHLDEVHALRDAAGADLVHLIVGETDDSFYNVCGIANLPGAFGITLRDCGGLTFAHELGHNVGLRHDRFRVEVFEGSVASHPAYGYVNRAVFNASAPPSRRWTTIMAYAQHCRLADVTCSTLPHFSNPHQSHDGDPLGIAFGTGSGLTGPSDAAAVLNAMWPAAAAWRDRPVNSANRPPVAVGTLPDRSLDSVGAVLDLDVSQAFADPDGEALTYTAWSAEPWLVRAQAAGAVATLTAAGEGTATIRVAATDAGGLSVSRSFSATVEGPADADPEGSVESDRAALEALYDATGGPSWTEDTNWKTSAPLGEWHGVTTDADGRVTALSLYDNGLAGPLPFELAGLANLEVLELGLNELTGPVPAWLGSLVQLRWLGLAGRWGPPGLSGHIPAELGNLANLEGLSLEWNELTGPIPGELGSLANLERLWLNGNELTGPIPRELGSLASLQSLGLGWNELTGAIPRELGSLANLERLRLRGNELTGAIPRELASLAGLESLELDWNRLSGRIPPELGNLASLRTLDLSHSDLSGPIPASLGNLANLERLDLSYAWGLSGPLPAGLERSSLEELDFFVTQTCAPAAWREWLATIVFWGPHCGAGSDATIDIAVVYTPAAREAAGGAVGIEAEIDLWIAETNQAYAASGVDLRLALVARSEVAYTEIDPNDVYRLADPSDGHLDEVHALRDDVGADLVHLIVSYSVNYGVCGIAAGIPSVFGLTLLDCGGIVFAHEIGHNLGLRHDRFQVQLREDSAASHPAYGYVNQGMFGAGAPPSSRWVTIMSYSTQCGLADARCLRAPRFSNPRQHYHGDPLGVAFGVGSGVTGAADAAAVLNATGPAAAAWRDRPRANHAPAAVGTLPDRGLAPAARLDVDVSQAFDDPDGDPLTYAVSSSAPTVVAVRALGPRVTLTGVAEGTAVVRVTANDPGGLSATQSFTVTVGGANHPPAKVGTLPDVRLADLW